MPPVISLAPGRKVRASVYWSQLAPLLLTLAAVLLVAAWSVDLLLHSFHNRELDGVNRRLDRIEGKLDQALGIKAAAGTEHRRVLQ